MARAQSPGIDPVSPRDSCGPLGTRYDALPEGALHWQPLHVGAWIAPGDAVLTCPGSQVLVSSDVVFGVHVRWIAVSAPEELFGVIPDETYVVVESRPASMPVSIRVAELVGRAFLSTEHAVIARHGTTEARSGVPGAPWVLAEKREAVRRFARLQTMTWVPLTPGDTLGPWSMIWVREGGRVEIEMIGRNGLVSGSHDVTDARGRPAGRKRFRSHEAWIVNPAHYDGARVTQLIGDAWQAADPGDVRAFFDTYHVESGTFRDPTHERREWRAWENLRRTAPGELERRWTEHVQRRNAEYQRWLDTLRGGELE